MSDFEPAVLRALKQFRTDHQLDFVVSCCMFHFCQLQLRNARKCGLVGMFSNMTERIGAKLRLFLSKVMALCHLPLQPANIVNPVNADNNVALDRPVIVFRELSNVIRLDVTAAFQAKLLSVQNVAGITADQVLLQSAAILKERDDILIVLNLYIEYVNRNWMDAPTCVAHSDWCVADLDDYRTNNNCEGLHNKALIDYKTKPLLNVWIQKTKE